MSKRVTAVEWLYSEWSRNGTIFIEDLEQAKQMEREQIIEAAKYGNSFEQGDLRCEVYYNETFKSE
jgi:hypothetical protein